MLFYCLERVFMERACLAGIYWRGFCFFVVMCATLISIPAGGYIRQLPELGANRGSRLMERGLDEFSRIFYCWPLAVNFWRAFFDGLTLPVVLNPGSGYSLNLSTNCFPIDSPLSYFFVKSLFYF
jgi:hypothetical protein